jgi:hypothetical protein
LAELLAVPRAELAKQYDELVAQVQIREKAHRDGTLAFGLLPRLRLPLILPIWGEASYSAKANISLPPYLAEGSTDNQLALHLARFGDAEAAQRLANPSDAAVRKQIDELACTRNYPVEWTRYVALLLHTAEYRLAMGEDEGRVELTSLHRQLREVLDAKAAHGPLGAALLAQGHKVLALAAAAWREHAQPDLADKADADLKAWDECPAPDVALPLGASSAAVADLLRSQARRHVLASLSTARALDLLTLPVTAEGAQGVIACFDGSDKLAEVLVVYRPRIADYYLEPAHLVLPLEDHGIAVSDRAQAASVHRRLYVFGELACDVAIVPRGYVLGAFVRFSSSRSAPQPIHLARDFGVVNLDRSFSRDRARLVPEQLGDSVQTSRAPVLAEIVNPLAPLHPVEAILNRTAGQDLVESFALHYGGEENMPHLYQAALPLWSALGPGRIEAVDDKDGGHLALLWEDALTRYTVRLPHVSGRPFEFEARDRRGAEALVQRSVAAAEFDRNERKLRLERRKPLARIPRRLEVGWSTPPGYAQLGHTREQVLATLPRGQSIVKQNTPDLLNVLFTGEPPRTATRATRQAFIRFGPDQKVAEIRVRYVDGPAAMSTARWTQDLYTSFLKPCGAALEGPGYWLTIWSDVPPRKPSPILARWQDDITSLTFQRDGTGAEAILRDCPLAHETGVPLPRFAYLPRGPDSIVLGEARDDLHRRWKIDAPRTLADGGVVLPPPKGSRYDALLVWFENDKVARVVARHAPISAGGKPSSPAPTQLTEAWGRQIRALGWPSRQEAISDNVLQSLGWHDDQTRIRMFWQESDEGPPRIFTEWKGIATNLTP